MNQPMHAAHAAADEAAPLLRLDNVAIAYTARAVVRDISFALRPGKIVCLLGPSGCGKTTVLRAIAGFERVSAGGIALNGEVVSAPGHLLPPARRRIGMVFQDYALFPHLTVTQNILFGIGDIAKREQAQRLEDLLQTTGLADVAGRYPHELSGGQQQRVALSRALAPRPALLLLDEPFSNLDIELRERLGQELRDILKRHGVTAIMVTHNQYEAFAIADEVGVMMAGELQQWDSAYNLYHKPRNRFVADFIGEGVFLAGTVLSPHHIEMELGILKTEVAPEYSKGTAIDVLLRPDDIIHDDASGLGAQVIAKAFRGADILYTLRLASGGRVLSLVPSHHNHAIGEKIGIRLEVDHVVYFRR